MNFFTRLVCLLAIPLLLAGCEKRADTIHPTTYSKDGLTFDHPGNWKVTEDAAEGGVRSLFVESPGDALVVIQIFPADRAASIGDFARTFSKASQDATPAAKFGASAFSAVTRSGEDEVLVEEMSISLLTVSVPHVRTYRRKVSGSSVVFMISQVATEDRELVTKGFEQIAASLRNATQ